MSKWVLFIGLLVLIAVGLLIGIIFFHPQPRKELSPSSKTVSPSPSPSATSPNTVTILNFELKPQEVVEVPKSSIPAIKTVYLTDDVSDFKKPTKNNFKVDQEIFLVLGSDEDNEQQLKVMIRDLNDQNVGLEYSLKVTKGMGFLSVGTSLPASIYQLTLINTLHQGVVITFTVTE